MENPHIILHADSDIRLSIRLASQWDAAHLPCIDIGGKPHAITLEKNTGWDVMGSPSWQRDNDLAAFAPGRNVLILLCKLLAQV